MNTAGPASAPHTQTHSNNMSTPQRLRMYLFTAMGLALLLFVIGEATLSRARETMKTIGRDAAPSIIAAQEINAALADLDASAANYLLGSQHQQAAIDTFEQRRVKITSRLVDAAENITYGDAERQPILAMFENLGRYLEIVSEARFRHDQNMPGALDTYRNATSLMHQTLLPAADKLDSANRSYMDSAYEEQRRASGGAELLAAIVGGGLALILVMTQLFILRKMRRLINLPLLIATVLTIVFTIYLGISFNSAREDLRVAKEDAFESIHLLWRARAIAYDANGDESRYLLDTANQPTWNASYNARVALLTSAPSKTVPLIEPTVRVASDVPFTGIFGDELRNVTFKGEWGHAARMVDAFAKYDAIDHKMRQFETSGKHDQAVKLCLGMGADESNAMFATFDLALADTLQVNKNEFDDVVEQGDAALKRAVKFDPFFAIAIALLAFVGIRPRLREYTA